MVCNKITIFNKVNSLCKNAKNNTTDISDIKTEMNTKANMTVSESAPTTATVGAIGDMYMDSTNVKLYICTAITTVEETTTYTWTEITLVV